MHHPTTTGSRIVFRRAAAPRDEVDQLFATPMLNRILPLATPEFLGGLKAYILDLERRDSGLQLSNFGGWHSTGDFFETDSGLVTALAGELLKLAAEISYSQIRDKHPDCAVDVAFHGGAWANVSRNGDFNKPHTHPGVTWSGVFYVDLGDRDDEPVDNGYLEFIDPRPGNIYAMKRIVRPQAGLAVLFPSWLCHYVNPFRGRGERISIAFNTTATVLPIVERRPGPG